MATKLRQHFLSEFRNERLMHINIITLIAICHIVNSFNNALTLSLGKSSRFNDPNLTKNPSENPKCNNQT